MYAEILSENVAHQLKIGNLEMQETVIVKTKAIILFNLLGSDLLQQHRFSAAPHA